MENVDNPTGWGLFLVNSSETSKYSPVAFDSFSPNFRGGTLHD
jgi:hypothetical protein